MSHISESEILEEVEWNEELLNSTLEDLEGTPKEEKPYFRLARLARPLGVYNLLLERQNEAVQWFTKSAEWFCGRRDQLRGEINEPQIAMWSVVTAILSTNDELAEEIATQLVEEKIEHRSPEYFTHFAEGLANLLLGNDERVTRSADQLTALEPASPEQLDFYSGLGDVFRAVIADDPEKLDDSLEHVLDWHTRKMVPKLGEIADDALVCFPATALLLLARKRGFAVEHLDAFESEYVPKALFEDGDDRT